MLIDPPKLLPVSHLSLSSINLWQKCRIKWKAKYISGKVEPVSPAAILGSAVGGALRDSYGHKIDTGHLFTTEQLLASFADGWDHALENTDVVWDDEKPGRVKDSGARILPLYQQMVAPTVKPIAVERGFSILLADVGWSVDGYFDVEEEDGIIDSKARSRSKGPVSMAEALDDLQPTMYLLARRSEGKPASRFDYHSLVRQQKGSTPAPRDVAVTPAPRTDAQLDALVDLIYRVAAEIAWAAEYEVWTPPPSGAWWCSAGWCGFYESCRYGGKLHPPEAAALRPGPARRVTDAMVIDAVLATRLKSTGATTAQKVAAHLGISTAAAAGRLSHHPRIDAAQPTKSSGRGKDKVTVDLPGPRVYRLKPDPVAADDPKVVVTDARP